MTKTERWTPTDIKKLLETIAKDPPSTPARINYWTDVAKVIGGSAHPSRLASAFRYWIMAKEGRALWEGFVTSGLTAVTWKQMSRRINARAKIKAKAKVQTKAKVKVPRTRTWQPKTKEAKRKKTARDQERLIAAVRNAKSMGLSGTQGWAFVAGAMGEDWTPALACERAKALQAAQPQAVASAADTSFVQLLTQFIRQEVQRALVMPTAVDLMQPPHAVVPASNGVSRRE